jgi:hypothetical protein
MLVDSGCLRKTAQQLARKRIMPIEEGWAGWLALSAPVSRAAYELRTESLLACTDSSCESGPHTPMGMELAISSFRLGSPRQFRFLAAEHIEWILYRYLDFVTAEKLWRIIATRKIGRSSSAWFLSLSPMLRTLHLDQSESSRRICKLSMVR